MTPTQRQTKAKMLFGAYNVSNRFTEENVSLISGLKVRFWLYLSLLVHHYEQTSQREEHDRETSLP